MADSNAKGDRRERELVNGLDEAGFAVMRAPASGSATERELPDVLAGDGDDFYAIEAKSSGGDPIYLDGEEVEALLYFARNFGARPRVGVRFDREDWYFFHPADCHTTDGGNYRVKKETALADGTDFAEFVGDSEKVSLAEAARNGRGSGDGEGESEGEGDGSDGSGGGRSGTGRSDGPDQATLDVLSAFERGDLTREEAAAMLE